MFMYFLFEYCVWYCDGVYDLRYCHQLILVEDKMIRYDVYGLLVEDISMS